MNLLNKNVFSFLFILIILSFNYFGCSSATTEGYKIEHRQAEYDREQIISQVRAIKHPGADFIIKHMLGLHN